MNLFDGIILNLVLLLFPLILWVFYMMRNKNIGKPEKDLIFDFCLVTSLYLVTRFGITDASEKLFLIINIPLIIAYIKKRNVSVGLLSVMLIIYYTYNFDIDVFLLIAEYLGYYMIYQFFYKRKSLYISLIIFFKLIIYIVLFLLVYNNEYMIMLIIMLKSIFMTLVIVGTCEKAEDVVNYHMTLKEIEQEKQFRSTLFRITHEIKNPIAVCKGYLDMFDVNNIKHSQKYVPILKEEIERTLILLQDFLCMTKIKIEHDVVDINMVLEDVFDNFIPILKSKDIQYDFEVSDDSIYIHGDYNRLIQVFINIIKNAIEAMESKEEGKLSVYTKITNKFVHVYIKDNGVGFTKEQLEKLGEPFCTTKPNGTGLGIALTKEIVKGHKGTIKYDSKINNGTTVDIKLPIINN
ncbi:MAG: HAMP domain-containing sensor histidine kinase [Bacilli bacterium]|nr:HAMP domain-containing sensor histidine kinase [Bacilli bacterium]MDD4547494.1 HAMP domain-containing sensor histidine kinase [Bacilli bacterium]